ncbi:YlmH/Sll1252 family protein [Acholeplasma vituli]|uniref:YlmH/Sll1252 family protein n=1 Tax=Paracholeplasma vituli TaxID=69473 RepID=A0ABT2PV19_9MOLU|nr:YlmH/Sll1252 family protein [Paracholeplasma vituli]MCU0104804.1 YlmH/Sll1252 family protein [Paracholeplasma vituli]
MFKGFHIYESDSNHEYARVYVTEEPKEVDFKIITLKSTYVDPLISHRDVLGALMHLGLERDTFGDIHITEKDIYIQVVAELKQIFTDLHQIKQDFIYFEEVSGIPTDSKQKNEAITLFLDSLRIDNLVSKAFNIHREDVKTMIDQEKVKINYFPVQKYTVLVKPYDIISVRGFGRIILTDDMGTSKSQKIRIKCELLR